MTSAPDLQVLAVTPQQERSLFIPRHDVRKSSANTMEERVDQLADLLECVRIEAGPVRNGLNRRKIRLDELTKVLEEWRSAILQVQPPLDDNQQQIDGIKKKIPNVLSQDKSQIPTLINKLLFHQVELDLVQERTQDLIYLLEGGCFAKALECFKKQAETSSLTLKSWSSWATKVVKFEQEIENICKTLQAQDEAQKNLMPRLRHAIKCLHKTTLLLFLQSTAELHKRIGRTTQADRADLQTRLSKVQERVKGMLPELDDTLRTLETALEPLPGYHPKAVDSDALQSFCQKANLRDAFYFNPCDYITYYSYWRGYYIEAQRIAGQDLALVAKGTMQLHETLQKMLKDICFGKKSDESVKPLGEQCESYINILSTLQMRLKDHLVGKEQVRGLYQTEFNPLVPRVVEYADALAEMLFNLRRVLALICKFSEPHCVKFMQVRDLVRDHFCPKAPVDRLQEALSLFHAMHALRPLKEEFEAHRKELKEHIQGRFLYNSVQMLAEALSVDAPAVLTLNEREQAAFNAVISREELPQAEVKSLPLEWLSYAIKRITKLLHVSSKEALDMEVELLLYVLRSDHEYREPFDRWKMDAKNCEIYRVYEERMREHRLPDAILEQACELFKLIYDTLIKRPPTQLAYAECWQVYSEFVALKPDSRALMELKRLAAQSLEALGIKNYYFLIVPEEGDLPLVEVLALGDQILQWAPEKLQRLLLRALYAAIRAKDEAEKMAGQKIVNTILEWEGLEKLLGAKKREFYTLIFENTTRKLICRQFDLIGPNELRLYREEGPVDEFTKTKTHPVDDDRINDALYNIIFCLEHYSFDAPLHLERHTNPL